MRKELLFMSNISGTPLLIYNMLVYADVRTIYR